MLLACEAVTSYGENFRRLRGRVSQEEIARRLKLKRQGNVSAIELGKKVPSVRTILRHAVALCHLPSELMKDVTTEYDRLRAGAYDAIRHTGVSQPRTAGTATAGKIGNRGGHSLATAEVAAPTASLMNDQVDPISDAARTEIRRAAADLERLAGAPQPARTMGQPTRARRTVGKHAAKVGTPATDDRPAARNRRR